MNLFSKRYIKRCLTSDPKLRAQDWEISGKMAVLIYFLLLSSFELQPKYQLLLPSGQVVCIS